MISAFLRLKRISAAFEFRRSAAMLPAQQAARRRRLAHCSPGTGEVKSPPVENAASCAKARPRSAATAARAVVRTRPAQIEFAVSRGQADKRRATPQLGNLRGRYGIE